jgi:hypothetical protein
MIVIKAYSRLVLLFLLLISANTFGQSTGYDVKDVSSSLLTWVKHLNNDVDKYCTREKAPQLKQYFASLNKDLTVYLKTRKKLSDSLFRSNISPGKQDVTNQELLKTQVSAVMQRMRDVTDLTSNELRAEGDKLNDELYDILYGEQVRYLSHLDAFLAGKDVSKRDLAVDGSLSYQNLSDCINIITAIEAKIARKM